MVRSHPLAVLALVVVGMLQLTAPPPSASAQTLGCSPSVLSTISPCISYLVGNSTSPTSTCCSQLAVMMQGQAQCLCLILGGGIAQLGFLLNQTQAYTLPGACRISFSTARPCLGFTAPVPAGAPGEAPALAPSATAPTPTSGGGVPAVDFTPSVRNAGAPSQGSGSKTPPPQASTASSFYRVAPALFFVIIAAVALHALI
ncbi:non-specific lipid transfer protein GPI-anchored 20-like [Zingiber officinale]|uniref:non-specific lipid transfer protein GPI-anchored 20-like n=1 Tax=Zingiber officinale TaxID=94328 RepID=UPI001C4C9BE5|nr:non-specific lipid transfer protein GPI-anchored 20-like [Zingiber officinale]